MSLLRTAARATVAASVVGNVHRRQSQRWAAQDAANAQRAAAQAPAAAAAPAAGSSPAAETASMLDQLTKLGELRTAGVLTDAEFEAQKQRILSA